jgi:type II secretory ATPase GspE/PulE/Tfp pilus assembly ATPase PilB-like protein
VRAVLPREALRDREASLWRYAELLPVDDAVQQMIVRRAPSTEIRQHAVRRGMTTLLSDARAKVLDGTTTVSELLRVCQREQGE